MEISTDAPQSGPDRPAPPSSTDSRQQQRKISKESSSSSALSSSSLHLEEHISLEHFTNIMANFHHHPFKARASVSKQKGLSEVQMTTEAFRLAISKLVKRPPDDDKLMLLCNKIDMDGLGFIDADEFCSYILQQLKEKESLSSQSLSPPFCNPPKFRHNMNSKEVLCRLCSVQNPPRYISVSKDGMVGTWSPQLQYQHGVRVGLMQEGRASKGAGGSVWITDFAVMPNCTNMVLSTSSRQLLFYDLSTQIYKCHSKLYDLPYIPLCLDYYSNPQSPSSKSCLLYGDVSGSVTVLTFHDPLFGLFSCKSKDEDEKPLFVSYGNLQGYSHLVTMQCTPHLHSDWVSQVTYISHNHCFFSCSNTSCDSLVMRDIGHKTNYYVFKSRKGFSCFDYCHSLNLLVTGSVDHTLAMWNPYVPNKPTATLLSHNSKLLSVLIAEEQQLILSLSQDLVLCAWNVFEHTLLQTITIKFPFSQRLPDFGPAPMILLPPAAGVGGGGGPLSQPPGQSLVILCNEYVAELKLGGVVRGSGDETNRNVFTSHNYPIASALYNKHFHQILSGCEGGVVNVWNVDSGNPVARLSNCHGKDEITAMNLDNKGRRLITGSRAGDIKVWQYMNSTCTKHMRSHEYSEVTGVLHIIERGTFLSVGWDKKITAFKDDADIYDVVPEESWNREKDVHLDDILCVSYAPPHYLATGSFDGNVKVWNTDLEKVITQFHSILKLKKTMLKKTQKSIGRSNDSTLHQASFHGSSSRPVSQRMAMYRLRSSQILCSQHVPVDQVLFLPTRIRSRMKGAAVLVTSEGGVANFWDLFGKKSPVGSFYITEYEEENVLAMKTDERDEYLLCGDTVGMLAVFNIKGYCVAHEEEAMELDPIARWKAHSQEVVSVEYVPHETRPLVLSASGDGTVRLWTLEGHFIGTFGQEQPWDLKSPATFQHPKTAFGEMWNNNLVHLRIPASTAINTITASQAPSTLNERIVQIPSQTLGKETGGDDDGDADELKESSPLISSSTELPPILLDRSLGDPYNRLLHKRMAERCKRRVYFSDKNKKTTSSSPFTPFHSLHLPNMEEISVPKI